MITRVSTSTEGYDPVRKGRRVVTIDHLHEELIGGTVTYAPNTRGDGSYNYTEIVGGEVLTDISDAIRRFFCRITGWCNAQSPSPPALPAAKSSVVKMRPDDDGESPGASGGPGFDDVTGQAGTADTAGMPASSAPEDYGRPTDVLPPGVRPGAPPPPLPAAAIPVMTSVLSRIQSGDPAALKSLSALAQSAPFNPVSAQTLKNLATLHAIAPAFKPTVTTSTPMITRALQPRIIAGGSVTHAVGDIFKLVLSPLAWTLDGTGRLTALAGRKLEVLSRMI